MLRGEAEIIQGWKVARIYQMHKGGDEEEVKNYRGVGLLNSGYKLYAQILVGRLRGWVERNNRIGESQAGFRGGGGGEAQEIMFSYSIA